MYYTPDISNSDSLSRSVRANLSDPCSLVVLLPLPYLDDGAALRFDAWSMTGERRVLQSDDGSTEAVLTDDFFFARSVPDPHAAAAGRGPVGAQTASGLDRLTAILDRFGARRADIMKINTAYVGTVGRDVIKENMEVRVAYFEKPGPAATGVPFPRLDSSGRLIQFDVLGRMPTLV